MKKIILFLFLCLCFACADIDVNETTVIISTNGQIDTLVCWKAFIRTYREEKRIIILKKNYKIEISLPISSEVKIYKKRSE